MVKQVAYLQIQLPVRCEDCPLIGGQACGESSYKYSYKSRSPECPLVVKETVKIQKINLPGYKYGCPACDAYIAEYYKFCRTCGKEIEWVIG